MYENVDINKILQEGHKVHKFVINPNKYLNMSLWDIDRYDLSTYCYGGLWDIFKQQLVYTIQENDDILFWFNKKLYLLNNNNVDSININYLKQYHYKINIIKERILYYWLKFNFYKQYKKSKKVKK